MSTSRFDVIKEYDKSHDVLYLHFAPPRPAVGEFSDICDSVVLKYALDNDELISATVLSFSKLDPKKVLKAIPVTVDLRDVQ